MTKIDLERALKPRFLTDERANFLNWHGREAAPRDPAAAKAQLRTVAGGMSFGRRKPERLRAR